MDKAENPLIGLIAILEARCKALEDRCKVLEAKAGITPA